MVVVSQEAEKLEGMNKGEWTSEPPIGGQTGESDCPVVTAGGGKGR